MTDLYLKAILKGLLLLMAHIVTSEEQGTRMECEEKMVQFSNECNDLFNANK